MQKINSSKKYKTYRRIRWDRLLIILAVLNGIIGIVAIGANQLRKEREKVVEELCLVETWCRDPIESVVKRKITYLGEFKLTGYCPCELCCGPYASGITATGTVATEGRTVAVDPNVIPLGSKIIIDDHEYIAEDTGSAVNGNVIDIFKNNHEDCFGADCNGYHEVYLVEEQ